MSKISIIVPVYKAEKYLRRCLDSIIEQTFTDWECILVDDGSPDGAGVICEEYAEQDGRFKVFRQENAGVSAARNKGLDEAKGEWITFVDSDDWVGKDYLENLYSAAIKYDAELVIGGLKIVEDGKTTQELKPKNGKLLMPKDFDITGAGNKLFKSMICKMYNCQFPIGIKSREDMYFNFQVIIHTDKVYGISSTSYYYYQNNGSAIHNYTIEKIKGEVYIQELIERKLNEINIEQKWYDFLIKHNIYVKNLFLFNIAKPNLQLWRNTFPDLNKYAIKNAISIKRKIVLFLAYKRLDAIAKLIIRIFKR